MLLILFLRFSIHSTLGSPQLNTVHFIPTVSPRLMVPGPRDQGVQTFKGTDSVFSSDPLHQLKVNKQCYSFYKLLFLTVDSLQF